MQIALSHAVATQRPYDHGFPAASIVLDFTRATAVWNGVVGPLADRLTCQRDAAAMAPDTTGALHSFARNALRCTSRGLLVEETRTNFVPHSFAPAQTALSLPAGTYTLSMRGTGAVVMSGDTEGSATAALPFTVTLATGGNINLTPSAGVTFMQLENGPFPTSPIATGDTPASRDVDRVTYNSTDWFDPQNCTILMEWEQVIPGAGVQTLLRWQNASYSRLRSGNLAVVQINNASGNLVFNGSAPVGAPAPGIHRLMAALAPDDMAAGWSASLGGGAAGSAVDLSGVPAPGANSIMMGSALGGEVLNGWIRKVAYWPAHIAQINLLAGS